MPVAKVAISLPEETLTEIDNQAENWRTSRSGTIARIIQEWLASRRSNLVDASNRFPPTNFNEEAA